ncbi:MAG TPA: hypothetical protein VHN55_02150 [Sphingomicrobium sp.]|nr:hypothetical protein [Sphingomicrobium sp.]
MAAPAAARPYDAAFQTSADRSMSQPFMFTGATVRLSLDGRKATRPQLAMRFAGGTASAGVAPRIGEGIAFSTVAGAKPRLTIAGQDAKILGKTSNMSDGGKAALIVGGVLLAVGALVVVSANEAVDNINDDGGLDW